MKIFEDRKTEKMFFNKITKLGTKEASKFSEKVTELFYKKTTLEDGEYKKFKITKEDLIALS